MVIEDGIFGSQRAELEGARRLRDIQTLSFGLCHVHAKATRSVSIPAPIYYADLACLRASKFYFKDMDCAGTENSDAEFDLGYWRRNLGKVKEATNQFFL